MNISFLTFFTFTGNLCQNVTTLGIKITYIGQDIIYNSRRMIRYLSRMDYIWRVVLREYKIYKATGGSTRVIIKQVTVEETCLFATD